MAQALIRRGRALRPGSQVRNVPPIIRGRPLRNPIFGLGRLRPEIFCGKTLESAVTNTRREWCCSRLSGGLLLLPAVSSIREGRPPFPLELPGPCDRAHLRHASAISAGEADQRV